ncbi:MAG: DUF177 domain-containing protein, partial [Oscillospiraceae bacterium]|nr:DUF177 domain-containing protein [Oscillospiraceae bacterium]
MILDLRDVVGVNGLSKPFDYSPDLSRALDDKYTAVVGIARAVGKIRNSAGALSMTALLTAELSAVCARCLRNFTQTVEYEFCADLSGSENARDDPELYFVGDGFLDLDDVIVTELVLNVLDNPICRPDCPGLCQTCGADLNAAACGCRTQTDPRLAV